MGEKGVLLRREMIRGKRMRGRMGLDLEVQEAGTGGFALGYVVLMTEPMERQLCKMRDYHSQTQFTSLQFRECGLHLTGTRIDRLGDE